MFIYFLIYSFPAFLAMNNSQRFNSHFLFIVVGIFFSLIIGLRHQVGGDWFNYINNFIDVQYLTYEETLIGNDPGYFLLNLIMYDLKIGIYGVNFICAIIFMYGLLKLAKIETNPWMFIAVAVPYTIIVVAMGYTRQAVALGFIMWAITYLKENKMFSFFFLVFLAAIFHKSSVLMIGLGIFANGGGKFFKIIAVGSIGIGLYYVFLSSHADSLVKNYVDAQMQSSGAFIRTFMNLIPAILLIIYRRKWQLYFDDYKLWFIMALLSIVCFATVGFASTAVDRMALYILPIQMIVFSRLGLLMSNQFSVRTINITIIGYYSLVLFVWLNYAVHADYWLPYQNILIYGLF